ncbi:MAG: hypothetical protein FJ265_08600 [Planctomycetes bacterium]|nr:hypothetical protein [Planctomycetota bacterium]
MRTLYCKHLAVVTIVLAGAFVVLIRMYENGLDRGFDLEHYLVELPLVFLLALPLSGVTCWVHHLMRARSGEP